MKTQNLVDQLSQLVPAYTKATDTERASLTAGARTQIETLMAGKNLGCIDAAAKLDRMSTKVTSASAHKGHKSDETQSFLLSIGLKQPSGSDLRITPPLIGPNRPRFVKFETYDMHTFRLSRAAIDDSDLSYLRNIASGEWQNRPSSQGAYELEMLSARQAEYVKRFFDHVPVSHSEEEADLALATAHFVGSDVMAQQIEQEHKDHCITQFLTFSLKTKRIDEVQPYLQSTLDEVRTTVELCLLKDPNCKSFRLEARALNDVWNTMSSMKLSDLLDKVLRSNACDSISNATQTIKPSALRDKEDILRSASLFYSDTSSKSPLQLFEDISSLFSMHDLLSSILTNHGFEHIKTSLQVTVPRYFSSPRSPNDVFGQVITFSL